MSSQFGLSCPSGGKFYICTGSTTEFVGCCASDPCAGGRGVCPQNNIKPLSYSGDSFKDIPVQACSNSTAQWYSCQKNSPPFLGCCTSNPCTSGSCPASRLAPAKLSSNSSARAAFLSGSPQTTKPSTTPTSSPTDKTSTPTTTASATPTGSTLPSNETQNSSGVSLGTGAIVGIAVTVAVSILIILGFIAYRRGWFTRRRKERDTYTTPFITGGKGPYDSGAPSPMPPQGSPSFGQFPHSYTPTPSYGSPPPIPGTPPHTQQLHPMYAAAKVPPLSPPLPSHPGSAHTSPRMGYHHHSSMHSQQLSELEVPLMLSETPGHVAELPSNEPAEPQRPASNLSGPLQPPAPGTQRYSTEMHLWDGGRQPGRGY